MLVARTVGGIDGCAAAQFVDARVHGNFVLLFDSSGSMAARTLATTKSDGIAKVIVARRAANAIFDGLANSAGLKGGLIIFGANFDGSRPSEREKGCRDVQTALPLDLLTSNIVEQARTALRAASASGYTPLGKAFEAAIGLLGSDGGSIVVVTDMEDTCEDGQKDYVCNVLETVNQTRLPANKVYVDSILVARAAGMRMDAVQRLESCSTAKVMTITNAEEATAAAADVVARLAALAEQVEPAQPQRPQLGDNHPSLGPGQQPRNSGLRIRVLDGRGEPLEKSHTWVVFHRLNDQIDVRAPIQAGGRGQAELETGSYDIAVEQDGKSIATYPSVAIDKGVSELTLVFRP